MSGMIKKKKQTMEKLSIKLNAGMNQTSAVVVKGGVEFRDGTSPSSACSRESKEVHH